MRVCVAGCGTAGPAAALFLARAGHTVTIFERAAALNPVGAGLLIQPTGMAVLSQLGVLDELLQLGHRIERLYGATTAGRPVLDLHYRDLRADLFGLGLHRGALLGTLMRAVHAAGITVRCASELTAIRPAGGGGGREAIVADAAGQAHGPFDLVIIADGARSSLRPDGCRARVRQYPFGALWFVGQDTSRTFTGTLWQAYHGTGRMLGFLPTGRVTADGPPLTSMFWSIALDRAAAVHAAGLDAWKRDVLAMTPLAAPLLEQVTDTRQLITAGYYDVVARRTFDLTNGAVVCLGDAAHAMSPQLGQGANLALVDAMVLAGCLSEEHNLPAALERFDAVRRPGVRYYQFASRWLTPIFQSDLEAVAPLRDMFMGPMCRLPLLRGQMLESLVGIKTGIMPWSRQSLDALAATRRA